MTAYDTLERTVSHGGPRQVAVLVPCPTAQLNR